MNWRTLSVEDIVELIVEYNLSWCYHWQPSPALTSTFAMAGHVTAARSARKPAAE